VVLRLSRVVRGDEDFNIVINATRCFNNRKWPEIARLKDFEGKLLHSANWDELW
jgi:cation diffusion facilitator CzcD-associated flavoprotein CzcO